MGYQVGAAALAYGAWVLRAHTQPMVHDCMLGLADQLRLPSVAQGGTYLRKPVGIKRINWGVCSCLRCLGHCADGCALIAPHQQAPLSALPHILTCVVHSATCA
jgi:hypothetical protein